MGTAVKRKRVRYNVQALVAISPVGFIEVAYGGLRVLDLEGLRRFTTEREQP